MNGYAEFWRGPYRSVTFHYARLCEKLTERHPEHDGIIVTLSDMAKLIRGEIKIEDVPVTL
jgi:hypothetical protein